MLVRLRALINEADPMLAESWKWNTAVWVKDGKNICAMAGFKSHVKVNFFEGSSLADPDGLLNSGLDAATMRSIDWSEGDKLDDEKFKKLVQSAAA